MSKDSGQQRRVPSDFINAGTDDLESVISGGSSQGPDGTADTSGRDAGGARAGTSSVDAGVEEGSGQGVERQAPPASTVSTALRDALVARGYENFGEFQSDDEVLPFFEDLAAQREEIQRQRALVDRGLASLEQEDGGTRRKQEHVEEPAAKEERASGFEWPSAPEFNPQWEAFCEPDSRTGGYRIREEYRGTVSPSLAEKLSNYRQWQRDRMEAVIAQFPHLVEQAVEPLIQKRIEEIQNGFPEVVQKTLAQREAEREQREFAQKNLSRFYQLDGQGQIRRDAAGEPLLTEDGRLMAGFVQEGRAYGINDVGLLRKYALDRLEAASAGRSAETEETKDDQGGSASATGGSEKPAAPQTARPAQGAALPAPPAHPNAPVSKGRQRQQRVKDAVEEAMHTSNRGDVSRAAKHEQGLKNAGGGNGRTFAEMAREEAEALGVKLR